MDTEMKVDSARIRAERERRAWSQEHLAQVAGLGVRTIQRIEATGAASYESTSALASCLDVPVEELRAAPVPEPPAPRRRPLGRLAWPGLALAVLAVAALVSMRSVVAEQVMLDIGVTLGNQDEYLTRVLLASGEQMDLRRDGLFNLNVMPAVMGDGRVGVAFAVFAYRDGEYELVGEPRLVALNEQQSVVHVGAQGASGERYRIAVTPTIQ